MGRRRSRKARLPAEPVEVVVEDLSHEGRGVARIEGKTVFVDNALPGERVSMRYTRRRRKFDEGRAEEILGASPDRVEPPCAHAHICGGCSLQHLDPARQIERKQAILAEQFAHFGDLAPEHWLDPLTGPLTGYRGKARLGVKYVDGRGTALVGFREKGSSFIADIERCEVLIPELGGSLLALRELINGLECRRRLPQIEVAAGDDELALVFRHLDPISEMDHRALAAFCAARGWHCYLQPGNEDTVHRIHPAPDGPERLYYRLPAHELEMGFHPCDFTQVNQTINRRMVELALELLAPEPEHRVLDLFCGLGNFSLPAARRAASVVGVEGGEAMVERGYENARRNGLDNAAFHAADLTADPAGQPWAGKAYDRVLLDPPRSGAAEVVPWLAETGARRVVYVSCSPATLARDAGEMKRQGYALRAAGVMDMFPHTSHVESIALFEAEKW